IKDVLFLGYGGGGFSFEDKEFPKVGKKFKDLIKDHKVFFIIHGPPYNTTVDEIMEDHVGNLTMREFIEEAKPDVVVCGHLHENFGRYDVLGETYVVNPGPEGKIFEV
ncbi:metallophosphoesterase, partial [Nanoarchaeota archaeon]